MHVKINNVLTSNLYGIHMLTIKIHHKCPFSSIDDLMSATSVSSHSRFLRNFCATKAPTLLLSIYIKIVQLYLFLQHDYEAEET